jgi:hypothetical protein
VFAPREASNSACNRSSEPAIANLPVTNSSAAFGLATEAPRPDSARPLADQTSGPAGPHPEAPVHSPERPVSPSLNRSVPPSSPAQPHAHLPRQIREAIASASPASCVPVRLAPSAKLRAPGSPDIRQPDDFPLYGPPQRWIANPLRLLALLETDHRRIAAGLSMRHAAEIAHLERADLSPHVGRYYTVDADVDEATERHFHAVGPRIVNDWLAARASAAQSVNQSRVNEPATPQPATIPSDSIIKPRPVVAVGGAAEHAPSTPQAPPAPSAAEGSATEASNVEGVRHPQSLGLSVPPSSATPSSPPQIATPRMSTATQSLAAAAAATVAAIDEAGEPIEDPGAAIEEFSAAIGELGTAIEAFSAADRMLRRATKQHRRATGRHRAAARQSRAPINSPRNTVRSSGTTPGAPKHRGDEVSSDPARALPALEAKAAVRDFVSKPATDYGQPATTPLLINPRNGSRSITRTRSNRIRAIAALTVLIAVLFFAAAWFFSPVAQRPRTDDNAPAPAAVSSPSAVNVRVRSSAFIGVHRWLVPSPSRSSPAPVGVSPSTSIRVVRAARHAIVPTPQFDPSMFHPPPTLDLSIHPSGPRPKPIRDGPTQALRAADSYRKRFTPPTLRPSLPLS